MDDRTGEIYTEEELKKRAEMLKSLLSEIPFQKEMKHFVPMEIEPTQNQMKRNPPKVERNEPCPCGSGRKFKYCHLYGGTETVVTLERELVEILGEFAGEHGENEGAVDCCKRITAELKKLRQIHSPNAECR